MPGEPEKGISIAETDPQDAKEQSLGLQRLGRKSGKIPTSWLVDDCEERRQSLKEDKTLLSESGAPMMMTDQGLQTRQQGWSHHPFCYCVYACIPCSIL